MVCPASVTSTQLLPPPPLKLLFRHLVWDRSTVMLTSFMPHLPIGSGYPLSVHESG